MNGKREETNAHGAGRVLSYEPLSVHCDACDRDYGSWESFGRHVDEIVDKPAATRQEAVMDVLADHLGDVDVESGFDPYVTDHGRIKCGCLAEFGDITDFPLWKGEAPLVEGVDNPVSGSATGRSVAARNIRWNIMFHLIFPVVSFPLRPAVGSPSPDIQVSEDEQNNNPLLK